MSVSGLSEMDCSVAAGDRRIVRKDATRIRMRLLIIDDHASFLDALAVMLGQAPAIEVVGKAKDGREGLRAAAELKPDMVLVDFSMPELDGLAVTRQLKAWAKPPKVVMMSFHTGPEYRDMALAMGADAFLTKTDLHKDLLPLLARLGTEAD